MNKEDMTTIGHHMQTSRQMDLPRKALWKKKLTLHLALKNQAPAGILALNNVAG
ncbi:hypothetical protein EJB05_25446 [Eragrostis curvula]|uniref:Uncharacterized protein n=1 Tax=Eragrostis curvula TaxID=38414 RepID=A0A5J9VFF9_9POAL|nr:hypothetical protein EJB05_25446 [Eragrostis curvula]